MAPLPGHPEATKTAPRAEDNVGFLRTGAATRSPRGTMAWWQLEKAPGPSVAFVEHGNTAPPLAKVLPPAALGGSAQCAAGYSVGGTRARGVDARGDAPTRARGPRSTAFSHHP